MKIPGDRHGYLKDETRYREWRAIKLDSYPQNVEEIHLQVDGLLNVSAVQKAALKTACKRANMAIYHCRDASVDRAAVATFASQFGLTRLDHHLCANADGVSELAVASEGVRTGYVPYSNRSLSWHTDGYYNDKTRQINAVVLHCAQSAEFGGENALLDPQMAYIRLRDEDPRFITAFEHPECMTIPANMGVEGDIRAAVSGPVFSYALSGEMHMRYSARKRNIQWRDDALTTAARECLSEMLDDRNGPVFRYRLKAGEGLISNNVLHNRTEFNDGPEQQRLLYRARFFDRIKT
ncbi:MAG: TauD/TfdA family dioxygenase [Xanthomonadales bacterium]|nr:TauD/TfdA family dioxygenase [Xanthomonadales bacterium]